MPWGTQVIVYFCSAILIASCFKMFQDVCHSSGITCALKAGREYYLCLLLTGNQRLYQNSQANIYLCFMGWEREYLSGQLFSEEKEGSGYWISNWQWCYTWLGLHTTLVADGRWGRALTLLCDLSCSLSRAGWISEDLTGHFRELPNLSSASKGTH